MKKRVSFAIIALAFLLVLIVVLFAVCENGARKLPETEKVNIEHLLQKEKLDDGDYVFLLNQTGLGKSAIEDLRTQADGFSETILAFQNQYHSPAEYQCDFIFFPTTKEEQLATNADRIKLPPLRDGDILITRSTHTLGFRHGHAGIVVDASRGKTVESVLLGVKSSVQSVEKWTRYPTLLILRPKDNMVAQQAASFAKEHLVGVDYSFLAGLWKKDKQNDLPMNSTHCSHLVWQAYYAAGLDIDGDGWLVLPQDIANCKELQLVFAYGFDAERRWES